MQFHPPCHCIKTIHSRASLWKIKTSAWHMVRTHLFYTQVLHIMIGFTLRIIRARHSGFLPVARTNSLEFNLQSCALDCMHSDLWSIESDRQMSPGLNSWMAVSSLTGTWPGCSLRHEADALRYRENNGKESVSERGFICFTAPIPTRLSVVLSRDSREHRV